MEMEGGIAKIMNIYSFVRTKNLQFDLKKDIILCYTYLRQLSLQ